MESHLDDRSWSHGGFHDVMGLPQARWMVYVMENPK